jgi:hypothetical protein
VQKLVIQKKTCLDVELGNQSAIDTLILLAKSKERYEIEYKYFEKWMEVKKIPVKSQKRWSLPILLNNQGN